MSQELAAAKAALRQRVRLHARSFTEAERARASERICQRLRQQAVWQQAGTVLLFHPLPKEPDIRPLLAEALAGGKLLALPRYVAADDAYQPCRIASLADDLHPGLLGILEPKPTCPAVEMMRLDFLLVPGVAFSPDGRRLGRGKGYYDRMLSGAPGTTCGVAFDWQVTDEVPREPHDVVLNCLLTPSRWQVCAGR
jgi:5-formyltetrahydrofolate cyclo-ligase